MEKEDKEWLLNKEGNEELEEFKTDKGVFVEPQSMIDKKGVGQYIPILNCYLESKDVKMQQRDLRLFYGLLVLSDISFDKTKEEHTHQLTSLYKQVFSKEPKDVLDDVIWESLGFQNSRPGMDFRGGGFLSLLSLYHLCSKEPALINDFIEFFKSRGNFLFACVVINSVYFLKNFFHFGVYKGYGKKRDEKRTCSRMALKYFLSLDFENSVEQALHAFNEIIRVYNKKLYLYWKSCCLNNEKITIMDFNRVDKEIQKVFVVCFENKAMLKDSTNRNSLSEFLEYFERAAVTKIVEV